MKPVGYLVLAVAAVMFVGGSLVGFSLLTSSADTSEPVATCEPRVVANGEDLTANLVTVDVYNASRTAGLANRVAVELQRRGFLPGNVSNNPTDIETADVVIVTTDPDDPRVKLVAAQFGGKVEYVEQTMPGTDNVAVLVGRNEADRDLKDDAATELSVDRDVSVCVPVVPVA